MAIRHVDPYTGEWLGQPVSYVRQVVTELGGAEWWAGPCDPRQATVLLGDGSALVWDEECGWRLGAFVSGGPDRHTELAGVRYLGGGLLPRPERVPESLADARAGVGASSAWRPCYRSHRNCRDGFDVALDYYKRLSLTA
ncbi:DUF6292 family protein [Nonomuraea sp. NPDC050310]|uniref:DUF6292 family protein n=1 Tax=unclassified Nonomuraea TaxID=2593643 RepID=UPI0033D9918D